MTYSDYDRNLQRRLRNSGMSNEAAVVLAQQLLATSSGELGELTMAQATATFAAKGTYLLNATQKLRKIKAGELGRFKWMTTYDSYAQKVAGAMAPYLFNAVGPVAGAYFSGTSTTFAISTNASTGTITDNLSDYAAWPSGLTSVLAAGASRTYGSGGGSLVGNTVRVFWINDGNGTFKAQIDGVDAATPTVTNDGSLGILTLTPSVGPHTVTIVGLTGNSKIVGIGYEDSTRSGACFINVAQGGIAMNSASDQAIANLGTFLATVRPDLISFEAKEDSSYLAAQMDRWLGKIKASTPHSDVLLIQSPPQLNNDTDNVAQNKILAAKATQYGYATWDSYTPFRDWTTLSAIGASTFTANTTSGSATLSSIDIGTTVHPLIGSVLSGNGIPAGTTTVVSVNTTANTLVMSAAATATASGVSVSATGWGADGTHVHADADYYRGCLMLRDLGIFEATGVQPFDAQVTNLAASATFKLGKTPSAPVLELDADLSTDLDVTAKVKRILSVVSTTGATDDKSWIMRPDNTSDQQIPNGVRIANNGVYLQVNSAGVLAVMSARGGGSVRDMQARAFIPQVQNKTAQSGAVTVDLSVATDSKVNLTGNMTSFGFSNPTAPGQRVVVWFIQDATGSRTAAGWSGSIVWNSGLGAPTLSTGPNKRDRFEFEFLDGAYYEVARTLNF